LLSLFFSTEGIIFGFITFLKGKSPDLNLSNNIETIGSFLQQPLQVEDEVARKNILFLALKLEKYYIKCTNGNYLL
jgi:hypothetical protein